MPPLQTVRVPELPNQVDPLSLDDLIPIYITADGKLRHTKLSDVSTLIQTGGDAVLPPVYNGGKIIMEVPAGPAGTQTWNIPSLAGLDFNLRRGGFPLIHQQVPAIAAAEYEVLAGGGFKLLKAGDTLGLGERFEIDLFTLQGGNPAPPGSVGGSFITGSIPVSTNFAILPSTHLNKLIQVRSLAAQITITLPSVADVPANTIIPIETSINNSVQNKIQTSGGQNIYFNNMSKTAVWMGLGENLWLYRGDDGWYVINDFAKSYKELAIPIPKYKVESNELLCEGQLVLRATYPRLWEYVQTLGSSLVSDATWLTASVLLGGRTVLKPYRGCFSTGDGSTTFRIPDLMNMFLRGVKSSTGSDTERHLNKPGGFQAFLTNMDNVKIEILNGSGGSATNALDEGGGVRGFSGMDGAGGWLTNSANQWLRFNSGLAVETRPDNVGVLWAIKV